MHPVKRVGADADGKMGHDLSIDCGGAKRAKVSAAVGMPNPHLTELNVDFLYHLGLNTSMDLKAMFGDVRFVLMGGSPDRMFEVIQQAATHLNLQHLIPVGTSLSPVGKHERYHLYKLGPIISVSHGMGMPSLSILLHEITKLLHYAGAKDCCYIRVGTSGGVGVPAGTVVITTEALNGELKPFHHSYVLGKHVKHSSTWEDLSLVDALYESRGSVPCVKGKTLSTDDFYEEQGRLDGYLCEYGVSDRHSFLERCHEFGVRNIEMEGVVFAAFCNRAKIRGAVVCVALLNRLNGDQIAATPADLASYSEHTITLVLNYVKAALEKEGYYAKR